MERYTCYCTEAQTKKALELGAPIEKHYKGTDGLTRYYKDVIPTAEQMIGWLLERIDDINIIKAESGTWLFILYPENTHIHQLKYGFSTRQEATLAAIDAALEYLSRNKKEE